MTQLLGDRAEQASIGARVECTADDHTARTKIPLFHPASGA